MVRRIAPLASIAAICTLTLLASPASGQDSPRTRGKKADAAEKFNPAIDNELEPRFGPEHRSTQVLGVRIKALGGSVKDAYGTLQIPTSWPEQTVRILKEELSPGVRNSKERETGLLKQFLFHIPYIDIGREESVLFTIEYVRKEVLPPEDPSAFVIPKKVDKELRSYLTDSPKLDPKAGRVSQTLKEIVAGLDEGATDWAKVEAIYNWVKDNIARHMAAGASTADVIKNKKGNTEDIVATFVALCRAAKVPARMVWLHEGVAAEFYLEDSEGKGRWFPCSYGAENEFGFSTETRPILLKGDSFRVPSDVFQVPEQKGEQRSIQESLKCAAAAPGGGRPQVDFLRTVTPSGGASGPLGTPTPPATEKKPGEAFIPIPGGGQPAPPPGASPPR